MIKAVLFDLDGTLIDTNDLIINSFKYTYKKHLNIDVDEKDIVMHFGEPLLDTLAQYDKQNAHVLIQTFRQYNESIHDKFTKKIEGAEETLKELRNLGIKVGVVTSKRRELAERGLNLFSLLDIMDVVVTPEDTTKHKPDGDPVIKACEKLNINPKEAVMVGDSHFDILCGKSAGAKTCLVKYTALPVDKIMEHNPDYSVEKINDIANIVKEENGLFKDDYSRIKVSGNI